MSVPKNRFAYTAPGLSPEFVSLNDVDGALQLTLRSPAPPSSNGATAMVALDSKTARELGLALIVATN